MGIEKERGISVVTSVMTFEYGDCVFNLLDTPGHEDFSEDTYRTLTAVDSAVMVIDAAKASRRAPQAVRGLPPARHPDRHLRQQARPGIPRPLRSPRRDREDAGPRRRPRHLADRARPELCRTYDLLRRRVRRLDAADDAGTVPVSGIDDPLFDTLLPEPATPRPGARRRNWRRAAASRSTSMPSAKAPDPGLLRLGFAQFRRARPDRWARRGGAAAAGPGWPIPARCRRPSRR